MSVPLGGELILFLLLWWSAKLASYFQNNREKSRKLDFRNLANLSFAKTSGHMGCKSYYYCTLLRPDTALRSHNGPKHEKTISQCQLRHLSWPQPKYWGEKKWKKTETKENHVTISMMWGLTLGHNPEKKHEWKSGQIQIECRIKFPIMS